MNPIIGTNGPDNLVGTAEPDTILGLAGNDTIDSVDRTDGLQGELVAPQRDVVDAGDDDDSVTGGRLDQLNGGNGIDSLFLNFALNGPGGTPAPPVRLTLDASGTGTDVISGTTITNFEFVNFNLTDGNDVVDTGNVQAILIGNGGNDRLTTGSGNDFVSGGAGNDTISTGAGNDTISGDQGNDVVFGGAGDDTFNVNIFTDGSDQVDLGTGNDTVNISRPDGGNSNGNIRVTFTSAEVGNGSPTDSNTMMNQDGGLAVRVQAENVNGDLTGRVSRYDDEGITFLGQPEQGITFDVRDLVSGVERGNTFAGVFLGTNGNDRLTIPSTRDGQDFYFNAGQGNDIVTGGSGNDFLVGGAGNDTLTGGAGNDSFIAGPGNDRVFGGEGNDTVIFNVATEGSDQVDLGTGNDTVNVSGAAQVRLTFTSAEVGNDSPVDSGTMANQNGTLAVRLQAEADSATNDGRLIGRVSQFDDEGTTFVAATGTTFDVRDLVSGVERGNQFEIVTLGTSGDDDLVATQASRSYYFNGGQGNDRIVGGSANDFLVGGAGNDLLVGGAGNDSFIGGAGDDQIFGQDGTDRAILSFARNEATFTFEGDTVTIVSVEGTDTYNGVEEFQFNNGTVVTFTDLMA